MSPGWMDVPPPKLEKSITSRRRQITALVIVPAP
jgi:hypothetical protein